MLWIELNQSESTETPLSESVFLISLQLFITNQVPAVNVLHFPRLPPFGGRWAVTSLSSTAAEKVISVEFSARERLKRGGKEREREESVFAINNSREQSADKIDDPFPESNKRSTARESRLMGPDRLVILLINATDMSAVAAVQPEVDPPRHRGSTINPKPLK